MKKISKHLSDNPNAAITFRKDHVADFKSQAEFVKYGKEQGYWDGHPEQDALLEDVYRSAVPEAVAPKKEEKK